MMLILPWLLGTGVTTAAIGEDEADVSEDVSNQELLAELDSELSTQTDLIQEYVSSETVVADAASGDQTTTVWEDVVVSFASDEELAGGITSNDVSNDIWGHIDAVMTGETTSSTASDEIDFLFPEIEEEEVVAVSHISESDIFDDFVVAAAAETSVAHIITPLTETKAFESASVDSAVAEEDDEEAVEIEVVVEDVEAAVEEDVETASVEVSEGQDVAPLYTTESADLTIFDTADEADVKSSSELASEIVTNAAMQSEIDALVSGEADLASADAQTIEIIRDFVAGEDTLLIEYAGSSNAAIEVEDDGEGNARIIIDGRHVAIVAAAAATITPNDIQLLKQDPEQNA